MYKNLVNLPTFKQKVLSLSKYSVESVGMRYSSYHYCKKKKKQVFPDYQIGPVLSGES